MGEELGEIMFWEVVEPFTRFRVMLNCEAPLLFRMESRSDTGKIFWISFDYLKLKNYCNLCLRMSHDAKSCPDQVVHRREPHRRRSDDEDIRREKEPRNGRIQVNQARTEPKQGSNGNTLDAASTSKWRPVCRDLLP
ncbi:unnamed protein product [Arabis nemorensis]|uniref:Zinc knuckle CX2CX4HX4C domain-containing protein n=1 Tax=Arabis nemorensis TaxID=586526 RepID=A0A565CPY6_9BRAS|nr:unnamed protein product [Arabis nemorensis]